MSLYQDNKFVEVEEVNQAVQQWRKENDQVAQFYDECCTTKPDAVESSADVYRIYETWAKNNDINKLLTQNLLTNRLRQFGIKTKKKSGVRVLVGIKLN